MVFWGMGLNCLFVSEAISSAIISPSTVTINALNFRAGGIVITGVFRGRMLDVIMLPAIMLPQASRLIGLITEGLFSLMGEVVLNRGCPMETKKITRRL